MRILFITNFYPPASDGWGYMQLCEEAADGLAGKGHSVAVLTSDRLDGPEFQRPYPVYRRLPLDPDPDWYEQRSIARQFFIGRRQREERALAELRAVLAEFHPEVVFVWHAIGLPKVIFKELERMPQYQVVYYLADCQPELADEYISYWEGEPVHLSAKVLKGALGGLALRILSREGKPIRLAYERTICVSDYIRQRLVSKGLISPEAVVIHNGVDLTQFSRNGHAEENPAPGRLRCLIAGRILPIKGVHTVVNAFALPEMGSRRGEISLTILGDGPQDYLETLHRKIQEEQLHETIKFRSPVPRSQMPEVLASYDVLILASEYEEPLARAIQEAMAMQLLVIGTNTGGSGELLMHERTGLVFEAGDPRSLAEQLLRALDDPRLVLRLRRAGWQEVVENFNIQRTVDQIEVYLLAIAGPGTARTDGEPN